MRHGLLVTLKVGVSAAFLLSLAWSGPGPASASSVVAVGAGNTHTCAVIGGGGVKCWGDNWYGQLGDGTTTNRHTPVDVSGLTGGTLAVSTGIEHTCALTSAGGVKCWGANDYGQLGDGTGTSSYTPVDVSGLSSGVLAVSAGGYHTCALTSGGGAKCWGSNGYGRLGDGTTTARWAPVDVVGLASGVAAVSAGRDHTCAITTGGGAKCWGYNYYGQLGDGQACGTVSCWTPFDVSGLSSGTVAVSAGWRHTCALTSGGGAKCWGDNSVFQLGAGEACGTVTCSTPVDVSGLSSGVASVTAAESHTCAVTSGGGAKCWGSNLVGQLGDGTTGWSDTPVDVSGLTGGTVAVSAGTEHGCALTIAGGVKCWGGNSWGQVGDGSTADQHAPVDVAGLGPKPVGGIAELPYVDAAAPEATSSSGPGAGLVAGIAVAAAGVLAFGGAGCYVLRRWAR